MHGADEDKAAAQTHLRRVVLPRKRALKHNFAECNATAGECFARHVHETHSGKEDAAGHDVVAHSIVVRDVESAALRGQSVARSTSNATARGGALRRPAPRCCRRRDAARVPCEGVERDREAEKPRAHSCAGKHAVVGQSDTCFIQRGDGPAT